MNQFTAEALRYPSFLHRASIVGLTTIIRPLISAITSAVRGLPSNKAISPYASGSGRLL